MRGKNAFVTILLLVSVGTITATHVPIRMDGRVRNALAALGSLLLLTMVWYLYHETEKAELIARKEGTKRRELKTEFQRLKETWNRLLPQGLLRLIDVEDFHNVYLGRQVQEEAAILTVDVMDFNRLIRKMKADEMFAFVNGVYSVVVPILSKYGVVDKFSNNGLTALYIGRNDEAMEGVLLVCKEVGRENRRRRKEGEEAVELSVGICQGPVMVGLVGVEERMELSTLSQYTGLSLFLKRLAKRYGIQILATSAFLQAVTDVEKKYEFRFIGYLQVRSTGLVEKLYDVYEEDEDEIRNCKKKTKIFFERGVELYTKGRYQDARLHFIEVLKNNRRDKVAMEYLNLCENTKERNFYFERY